MSELHNTLTHAMWTPDKRINMYTCGPTVYNRSHLGHARTFITFDLLVRQWRASGKSVTHAMNITDIDDKILHRLITNKFLSLDKEVREPISTGAGIDESNLQKSTDLRRQLVQYLQTKLPFPDATLAPTFDEYLSFVHTMEEAFWNDMRRLDVVLPDVIIRVSDVMGDIVEFISRVITNGFAYTSNGSVYFDTQKYKESGFDPAPLHREVIEDDFTGNEEWRTEKKNLADFALWKAKKPYELAFESPWGDGRPGWHIECSSMIHQIFGKRIDVHAGGVDLSFPHHNNEFLQSVAYYHPEETDVTKQWCPVFLHAGHLMVGEDKMSQSLGNFTTIEQFLANEGDATDLRLMTLSFQWDKPANFSPSVLSTIRDRKKRLNEFMKQAVYLQNNMADGSTSLFGEREEKYDKAITHEMEEFHRFIDNGFDTHNALLTLEKMVRLSNDYLMISPYNPHIFLRTYDFVRSRLLEWGVELYSGERVGSSDLTDQLMHLIIDIREELRSLAKTGGKKGELFALSDWIRDVKLKELGVEIQDKGDGPTKWVYTS